jgi:hypothetical protein
MTTLISREASVPYVNTGFIATQSTEDLVHNWAKCVRATLALPGFPQSAKFYAEQISFPIAATITAMELEFVDRDWNFPSWRLQIGSGAIPIFFHYQRAERLLRERATARLLSELCMTTPAVFEAIVAQDSFKATVLKANLMFS